MSNEEIANLIIKTSYAMASFVTGMVVAHLPQKEQEKTMSACMEMWDKTFKAYLEKK